MSFSVREFRDMDLMSRLKDTGPIASKDLAVELGFEEFGSRVGRRLGWMKRYGMLERDDNRLWSLSEGGKRVMHARHRARLMQELGELPEEELIEVMAAVMARYRLGQPMVADMMRREFVYATANR